VPAVLLLHGLAGHAGEWDATAAHLAGRHRVLCPDQRGHGRSDRRPADVSQDAFAADAAAWIEALGLAPAVVAGQSLGGLTAMLLAAQWPHLVRGLLVVEATPYPDPGAVERVRAWLAGWPVPFASREAALVFFGGDTAWARAWAGGLEERDDGLWPAFEPDVVLAALRAAGGDLGAAWAAVTCPVLVVRAVGEDGREPYVRMVEHNRRARLVEVPDAGHDLHLDQPQRWYAALDAFLATLLDRG
jgi:pimeloyl-ACP methyl ester carboxylesterase